MPQGRVLVVDDDATLADILRRSLEYLSLEAKTANSTAAALTLLGGERFDAVLCDLVMDGGGGMEVLRFAKSKGLQTPVVIITGHSNLEVAEDCLASGAFDFISKPIDLQSLTAVLRRALLRSGLIFETMAAPAVNQTIRQFPFLVGTSQPMVAVLRGIAKVAEADSNVCVYGESGTGKELVARAIHYSSRRAQRPLIVFDCTAIPEGLMESEMFGHVKGSFTSAVTDRDGVFQLAEGGSLLIDEIGDLSLPLQAKLLRVIQSREFRKVGGRQSIKVDVRIIAATNKDIKAMVENGQFREDLYFRLEVIPITLPPLRQHKEDIPLLVDHFIQRFNRNSTKQIRGISSRTMAALLRYHWPGNVRELENCIERAAVMTDGKIIDLEDISPVLRSTGGPLPSAPPNDDQWPRSLKESRKGAERELILKTLQSVSGNRTRAAELLGISLRTLHYKLKGMQQGQVPPIPVEKGVGPQDPATSRPEG
jgi:two-component system, NtrC family, response regulator AtoC